MPFHDAIDILVPDGRRYSLVCRTSATSNPLPLATMTNNRSLPSPATGKSNLLDEQFSDWKGFLNEWGSSAFLLFLACLGTGEHKHFCALLSISFLGFGYWENRGRFPIFVRHLRSRRTPEAKSLEKEIWKDHLYRQLLRYYPFMLGVCSLGGLLVRPIVRGNWHAFLSFLPL